MTDYQQMMNLMGWDYNTLQSFRQAEQGGQASVENWYQTHGMNGQAAPQAPAAPPLSALPSTVTAQPSPTAFDGLRNISSQIKYDSQGRPIKNDYLSMTDSNGNLLSQFQLANRIGPDVQVDKTGLNEIQNRATSSAPSAWANLAQQKLQLDQTNALDRNAKQQQAAFNQGYANLAGRGGISAGQRERMAQATARSAFQGDQGIRNQGMQGALNIGLQDQQTKDAMLMQLPGMQQQQSAFDQAQRAYRNQAMSADVGNAMKDIQGYNAYNAGAYSDAMKEWGAAKTADAQAHAGGGGKK